MVVKSGRGSLLVKGAALVEAGKPGELVATAVVVSTNDVVDATLVSVDGGGNPVEITECGGDTDGVVNVNSIVEFDTTIVEVKKVVRSEMVVREKLGDESVV
jgi:hypothetical protein